MCVSVSSPDDWQFYPSYFDSLFHLMDQSWSPPEEGEQWVQRFLYVCTDQDTFSHEIVENTCSNTNSFQLQSNTAFYWWWRWWWWKTTRCSPTESTSESEFTLHFIFCWFDLIIITELMRQRILEQLGLAVFGSLWVPGVLFCCLPLNFGGQQERTEFLLRLLSSFDLHLYVSVCLQLFGGFCSSHRGWSGEVCRREN